MSLFLAGLQGALKTADQSGEEKKHVAAAQPREWAGGRAGGPSEIE